MCFSKLVRLNDLILQLHIKNWQMREDERALLLLADSNDLLVHVKLFRRFQILVFMISHKPIRKGGCICEVREEDYVLLGFRFNMPKSLWMSETSWIRVCVGRIWFFHQRMFILMSRPFLSFTFFGNIPFLQRRCDSLVFQRWKPWTCEGRHVCWNWYGILLSFRFIVSIHMIRLVVRTHYSFYMSPLIDREIVLIIHNSLLLLSFCRIQLRDTVYISL